MTEKVFQRDDCMVRVKYDDGADCAWLDWAASKNAQSLNTLAEEVKDYLLERGVKRVLTSISAEYDDGEAICNRAIGLGFVPYQVVMQLVIDPSFNEPV